MKPTKEKIEEAMISMCADCGWGETIIAAYRSTLARAQLAERHERELNGIAEALDDQSASLSDLIRMRVKHERERKELEA